MLDTSLPSQLSTGPRYLVHPDRQCCANGAKKCDEYLRQRSQALPKEANEPHIFNLPRLTMHFNQHGFGRLYELIEAINDTCDSGNPMVCHPEQR